MKTLFLLLIFVVATMAVPVAAQDDGCDLDALSEILQNAAGELADANLSEAATILDRLDHTLTEAQAACSAALFDNDSIPISRTADGGFVLGYPDAPVTIVEFADFMCPHCQIYATTIDRFVEEFVVTGKANLEFRMVAYVDPTYSSLTAGLAECAGTLEPGLFWRGHDVLFDMVGRGTFHTESTQTFAEETGLDVDVLSDCIASAAQVDTDMELARTLGVTGVPAVMVRYGDSQPQWIEHEGETFSGGGGVDFDILTEVVRNAHE